MKSNITRINKEAGSKKKFRPKCKFGNKCKFLKQGNCKFYHPSPDQKKFQIRDGHGNKIMDQKYERTVKDLEKATTEINRQAKRISEQNEVINTMQKTMDLII